MEKFKRSLVFSLVLVLALSTFLVGCGSSNKGSSNDESNNSGSKAGGSKDQVEITWLVRSNPDMQAWYDKMIEDFEAAYSHIKVKIQIIPQDDIDQRLTTMIAGGNVPDVWSSNWANSGFATYQGMGALLDMTPYINLEPQAVEGISEDTLDIYNIDGKYYGIPMLSLGSFLYYNKELFDEAGLEYPPTDWDDTSWTWEKMVEYAKVLTKDVGDINNQVYGVFNNQSANKHTWLFGGDILEAEAYVRGTMGEPDTLNPKNIEALQAQVDLVHVQKVHPNPAQVEAVSALGDPFLTGKVAMAVNGGWGFWSYSSAEFEYGVAAMPYTGAERKIPVYVDPWNISAGSKHPDEAWEFIKFITNPEGGGKVFMEMSNATPAHTGLAEQWYEQMAAQLPMTVEQIREVNEGAIRYGRGSDNHLVSKFSTIGETIGQTYTSIQSGEVSVEEGLEQIDSNLRALNLD